MAFHYRFLIRCGVACTRANLERIVERITDNDSASSHGLVAATPQLDNGIMKTRPRVAQQAWVWKPADSVENRATAANGKATESCELVNIYIM